jgi:hypothetical protein
MSPAGYIPGATETLQPPDCECAIVDPMTDPRSPAAGTEMVQPSLVEASAEGGDGASSSPQHGRPSFVDANQTAARDAQLSV